MASLAWSSVAPSPCLLKSTSEKCLLSSGRDNMDRYSSQRRWSYHSSVVDYLVFFSVLKEFAAPPPAAAAAATAAPLPHAPPPSPCRSRLSLSGPQEGVIRKVWLVDPAGSIDGVATAVLLVCGDTGGRVAPDVTQAQLAAVRVILAGEQHGQRDLEMCEA
ncbi:unnamed protein product [Pylaiella littoralis]